MVPSAGWFLYGFVRKEAVVSSQIEGTQATLEDVVVYETTRQAERPVDVEEVCNYIDAMAWLCNALGRSGQVQYKETLREVSKNAGHRKIRSYAKKNYKLLK